MPQFVVSTLKFACSVLFLTLCVYVGWDTTLTPWAITARIIFVMLCLGTAIGMGVRLWEQLLRAYWVSRRTYDAIKEARTDEKSV